MKSEGLSYFERDKYQKAVYRTMVKQSLKEQYIQLIFEQEINMTMREFFEDWQKKSEMAELYEMAAALKDILDEGRGLD